MTKITILLSLSILLYSCCGYSSSSEKSGHGIIHDTHMTNVDGDEVDHDVDVQSDYDMDMVDEDDMEEFKENLAHIEKEHGEQWDFCTCVVKNDSINKAFSQPVSDAEFDRLSNRFDEIETHCQAFLVQNPNATPEERAKHEKKVKKCLKDAGVK